MQRLHYVAHVCRNVAVEGRQFLEACCLVSTGWADKLTLNNFCMYVLNNVPLGSKNIWSDTTIYQLISNFLNIEL